MKICWGSLWHILTRIKTIYYTIYRLVHSRFVNAQVAVWQERFKEALAVFPRCQCRVNNTLRIFYRQWQSKTAMFFVVQKDVPLRK